MDIKFERMHIGEPRHELGYATLSRAKVPGGWLVSLTWAMNGVGGPAITFYPDPEHEWEHQTDTAHALREAAVPH